MKKIGINKYICLLVLFIGVGQGYGQDQLQPNRSNYPDTLVLKTEMKNEVTFSFNRISRKKDYLTNDLWNSTLSLMETAATNSDLEGGLMVRYRKEMQAGEEVAKVEVSRLEKDNDIYVIDRDQMTEKKSDRVEFWMLYDQVAISFSINDLSNLEDVKSLDIESVWSQIGMKFENQGKRNLYRGIGEIKYGKANIEKIEANNSRLDNIELSAGVGLGFYRDRWVPDITGKVAFNLLDRLGNKRLQFGLLFTEHYFFKEVENEGFDLELNSFLSAFGSLKSLGDYELGLGIGTLIYRQGDFYKGSTYKFSLYTQKDHSKITFTPELIITNDFKDVFPAIKFGLSF